MIVECGLEVGSRVSWTDVGSCEGGLENVGDVGDGDGDSLASCYGHPTAGRVGYGRPALGNVKHRAARRSPGEDRAAITASLREKDVWRERYEERAEFWEACRGPQTFQDVIAMAVWWGQRMKGA